MDSFDNLVTFHKLWSVRPTDCAARLVDSAARIAQIGQMSTTHVDRPTDAVSGDPSEAQSDRPIAQRDRPIAQIGRQRTTHTLNFCPVTGSGWKETVTAIRNIPHARLCSWATVAYGLKDLNVRRQTWHTRYDIQPAVSRPSPSS